VDHTTIFRWIQAYAADLEKRIRPHRRMANPKRKRTQAVHYHKRSLS
jgi:transposase-like protein